MPRGVLIFGASLVSTGCKAACGSSSEEGSIPLSSTIARVAVVGVAPLVGSVDCRLGKQFWVKCDTLVREFKVEEVRP